MMGKMEQKILIVLLDALYEKTLVSKEIYDKAREEILRTAKWPDWFQNSDT